MKGWNTSIGRISRLFDHRHLTLGSLGAKTLAMVSKSFPTNTASVTPKRALLSVSDKTGLLELAKALHRHGIELVSTGGTHKAIKDAGIPVKDVSEITGFPEVMDGRVKTLHPSVHGGLLARRDDAAHVKAMSDHNIGVIDIVVINLYPFAQTVGRNGAGPRTRSGNG